MTRRELLARMPSHELTEWQAYERVEPFGEARADLRMAILAALIANTNRDPKARREPFTPADFMPFLERDREADLADKIARVLGVG